jgi:tellurite resistance protein TerC
VHHPTWSPRACHEGEWGYCGDSALPLLPCCKMPSTPISYWAGFHVALVLLLAVELVYARRRIRLGRSQQGTAIAATALWVAAAIGLGALVWWKMGAASSMQYLAGYALEQSLSVDNLFVFLLLFRAFRIEATRQPKVLFWGVAGAIAMRGAFIAGGISLLARFSWVSDVFGVVLLVAAVRLLMPEKPKGLGPSAPRWLDWLRRLHPVSARQDAFVVREDGHVQVTILLLALVAIELTDVVFALDSIPAVLSITRQPFLAYTSNIMAVMGLRSLYFLLIGMLTRLKFLHYGLAAVLGFAAVKMLASRWIEIGPGASLGAILAILGVTVGLSLLVDNRPGQISD